jgi:hypothetical protein
MAGHQRTADTPEGGGRTDTPAGGGQAGAILRMGIHAYATGEGRIRREHQHGGREDLSTSRVLHRLRAAACKVRARGVATIRPSPFHKNKRTRVLCAGGGEDGGGGVRC